jgi:hypothetical protein
MKIILSSFFFFFFQISLAQKKDVKIIINEAKEAFKNNDYETTIQKIDEIKIEFKKNTPPPFILSMEIISKSKLIQSNFLDSFELITDTRNLINKYLKNPNSKKDNNYNAIVLENKILDSYPKDLEAFNEIKEAKRRKEQFEKEQKEKAEAEEKARKERIALETKARQERIALEAKAREEREANARAEMLEQERIKNEQLAIEREKNRLAQVEADRKSALEALEYSKKVERENKRRLYPFSSIGLLSGEIAKYGFIYERGGRKRVGFRFSARTSLTPEEDILTGKVIENKTEIELGPNIKILKRIYFNIGVGYGYYDRLLNNDFAGEVYVEKTGYSVATTGLMIRLNNVISINGGASFMDIDKEIYKPEITFGISFNLRGKY